MSSNAFTTTYDYLIALFASEFSDGVQAILDGGTGICECGFNATTIKDYIEHVSNSHEERMRVLKAISESYITEMRNMNLPNFFLAEAESKKESEKAEVKDKSKEKVLLKDSDNKKKAKASGTSSAELKSKKKDSSGGKSSSSSSSSSLEHDVEMTIPSGDNLNFSGTSSSTLNSPVFSNIGPSSCEMNTPPISIASYESSTEGAISSQSSIAEQSSSKTPKKKKKFTRKYSPISPEEDFFNKQEAISEKASNFVEPDEKNIPKSRMITRSSPGPVVFHELPSSPSKKSPPSTGSGSPEKSRSDDSPMSISDESQPPPPSPAADGSSAPVSNLPSPVPMEISPDSAGYIDKSIELEGRKKTLTKKRVRASLSESSTSSVEDDKSGKPPKLRRKSRSSKDDPDDDVSSPEPPSSTGSISSPEE